MGRKKRKCPYCKSMVSYFGALSELNSGEHTCPRCYKNSNIAYNKMIYIPAVIALVIAIIVAAMFFVFKIIKNLILALVLILVPFAVFYFLTPLFFTLEEIKNEAQTPVMFEPKRAARAEKQSRTLKSDEIAKSDNVKKEQKSSQKKKSGGGKLANFVRTYIIVPDDEEENNIKSHDKKPEPKIEDKPDEDSDFVIVREDEIFDTSETEDISQQPNERFVDISSESASSHENSKNDVRNKQEKSADKPKLNFNKLFSKLIFSDENDPDTPVNNITPEIKSDDIVSLAGPVYHRLTKTNKVNFIYYPDKKAIISVDLNIADEKAEDSKNESEIEIAENFAEQENNDVTESIEMVVEKAIEAEKNEEENREIINFFAEEPNESDEEELGEENTAESRSDSVSEEFIEDDWVEYKPETGDFITLDFKRPEKNISSDSIIGLSDVNFDIPESEDIENIEDNFIDYDIENKLPFIVVEDSQKKISELDRQLFEKNPTKYEWNVFSAEKISFEPQIVDFNNNLINSVIDDEIDYKAEYEIFSQSVTEDDSNEKSVEENSEKSEKNDVEVKNKHKFGLFSKYVSKIKNESVFNFNKSVDSSEETDENPTEILEFNEELPEEVEVDEVIEFDSVSDNNENKENISIITTDDYIKDNDEENKFNTGETAEPRFEEDFSDNLDIEELIEEQNNNELLKNETELDTEKNSVTSAFAESEKAGGSESVVDSEKVTEAEVEDFIEEDKISESKTSFDMDYESVADEVVNAELESTEITESHSVDDELEIFDFSDLEEQENNVEENDDYYIFDEEDDEEISEEDDDYYKFDEENDEVPEKDDDYYKFDEENDEVPEKDDDYYKFDEENDEVPEKDDDYYKFDEEDDEVPEKDDDYYRFDEEELAEGDIIPEENDDNYVVDYSSDKNDDFEDISSGEQLDENFNLEEFRAMSIQEDAAEEKAAAEPVIPVKIDSSGNIIDDLNSRYEKKFPNAAKAAAEQAAALEIKKQKAKKKKSSGETVNKNSQKTKEVQKKESPKKDSAKKDLPKKDSQKKDSQKSKKIQKVQEQKTGFFLGLKNKIIEATEEERQAAFEEEERERKLAEKEARRKAKEKEKEKAEKLKAREEKEKNRAAVGVNTAKDSYEKLERQAKAKADAEERKKKSQKTKRIEKNKVKIPSDVPANGKTLVFDGSDKTNTKEFKAQEKIVLDSVKDKVKELENKKVTEAEKVKIISEKVDEEKRLEEIEKLKSEQEEQRVKKEKKLRERQLQNERLEKAEEIRREQVKQVRRNQNERKKSEEKRDTNNVSLKEVDNVRSKVSQKKKKRKQEINEVL